MCLSSEDIVSISLRERIRSSIACRLFWFLILLLPAYLQLNQAVGRIVQQPDEPYVILLGIAQDAGYPQAGCQKECCHEAWNDPTLHRYACCLAIVDPISKQRFLIECTPDFKMQLRMLDALTWTPPADAPVLDGIFLTHAHIGHYAGLIHLGREAMGVSGVPVYTMPRMQTFLEQSGPWNQLVTLKNIELKPLQADQPVVLNERLSLTPILVPHRGEFSETVAFIIEGPNRRVLFLPDIDRWEDWDRSIESVIESVDIAFLDGTFLADGELPGRDMSTIPHPTIEHSLKRFATLPQAEREKIHFIHLNHTNPLLRANAKHPVIDQLEQSGMKVGVQNQLIALGASSTEPTKVIGTRSKLLNRIVMSVD
jgi:pyrroloquinoline quinone biosynthesis protein B